MAGFRRRHLIDTLRWKVFELTHRRRIGRIELADWVHCGSRQPARNATGGGAGVADASTVDHHTGGTPNPRITTSEWYGPVVSLAVPQMVKGNGRCGGLPASACCAAVRQGASVCELHLQLKDESAASIGSTSLGHITPGVKIPPLTVPQHCHQLVGAAAEERTQVKSHEMHTLVIHRLCRIQNMVANPLPVHPQVERAETTNVRPRANGRGFRC